MNLTRRKAYNLPVKWSNEEEKKLLYFLKNEKFNSKKIQGLFPKRSFASIRSKVRKFRIKYDLFGEKYRNEKENFTINIAKNISPHIVFEAYAGVGHQTFKWIEFADKVYASEKMKSKFNQFDKLAKSHGFKLKKTKNNWICYKNGIKKIYLYIGDVIEAAAFLKTKKLVVDIIDLDTCGSTIPVLPTLLLLLKPKHILITHGEFHSMRFKREDVLRRLFVHRDIKKNPFPLSVEKMSNELDKAVKLASLRAHNETTDSFWLNLKEETWLGNRFHGMLRRHYVVKKPLATSDCINEIST